MMKPFVSITSDFGIASEGCGVMKATVWKYCPDANIIDLTHEVSAFNIKEGARELESVISLPVGVHVCVVDPGVGTKRKGIIILTNRGDYLIGPDNGVLIPAAKRLDGIQKAVAITNEDFMQQPVSPTFHGRDVFCSVAGHLARGVKLEEFGEPIPEEKLVAAPYFAATVKEGRIHGEIIHTNKHNFNVYSNIYSEQLQELNIRVGDQISAEVGKHQLQCKFLKTFGETGKDSELVYMDDYGHVAIGINQGLFAKKYPVDVGEKFEISK